MTEPALSRAEYFGAAPPAPPGLPPAAALMGWVRMWVTETDLAEWEDPTPFLQLHAPVKD